ncbi:MAG: nitrogenase component 1 [Terrimicrobiaceae bacterium]|nr:nitrogenase component 1 [Terrimicrobiaceae bacterium]
MRMIVEQSAQGGIEWDGPQLQHCTGTRNACKLCTPLGACLAFRGIEGSVPFLHGSQGCSTYIRRYLISHFREPMDIASSNFHEESAIFGGSSNFRTGIRNVVRQYQPAFLGVATTCLAETIGEDMPGIIHQLRSETPDLPPLVHVSTASYRGTHIDGFHAAVRATIEQLAFAGVRTNRLNVLPGMVSAEDLRHLKEILEEFGINFVLLPDYSETMDGGTWERYQPIQPGGTRLQAIGGMGGSRGTVEFGTVFGTTPTGGAVLEEKFGVPLTRLVHPCGIRQTDAFFGMLERFTERPTPEKFRTQRARLIDAYIDGHKYVFQKRAIVYGEEDLVIALTSFLQEIGIEPVLCASGGRSGRFESALRAAVPDLPKSTRIREGFDFAEIAEAAPALAPDLLVGSSKGYQIARRLGVPLVRVGFPIHDRVGGHRILHLGYRGAQRLFDEIVNTIMEQKQTASEIGYAYL